MQHVQAASSFVSHAGFVPGVQLSGRGAVAPSKPEENCGWFDSSFDLTQGLDVCEQHSDMLYQLWSLSQR